MRKPSVRLLLAVVSALVLSLLGCGGGDTPSAADSPISTDNTSK